MLASHNIIELILRRLYNRKDRNNLSICNKRIYTVAKRLRLNNKCDCDYFQYNAIKHINDFNFATKICKHGTVDQLKLLVEKGLKITENHLYRSGYNPEPVFEYILINFDIEIADDFDIFNELLIDFIRSKYFDRFKRLLEYSINLGGENVLYSNDIFLWCIDENADMEIIKYMLRLKDIYPQLEPIDLHSYIDNDFSGLYCVPVMPIVNKNFELLKFMFDLSVEQCRPFDIYSNCCIIVEMIRCGNPEIIKFILEIFLDADSPYNPNKKSIDIIDFVAAEAYLDLTEYSFQFILTNTITKDNIDLAVEDIAVHGVYCEDYDY